VLRAQQLEAAQRHGAGRRAVAVVIGHDADLFAGGHHVGQQLGRLQRAAQRRRRQQPAQAVVELVGRMHAPRRIQLRQQRVDAGLLQRPDAARRDFAYLDFHEGF
jgi:hypothetical protein